MTASGTTRGTQTVAGFGAACGLLLAVVLVFAVDPFAGRGWRDGEYVYLFIVATGAVIALGALLGLVPRWRSFGKGLALGGLLGVLVIVAGVAATFYALSQLEW